MFCEPHRVTFSIGEDFFAYQIDGIGKETNVQKKTHLLLIVFAYKENLSSGIFQDTYLSSWWLCFMWIHERIQEGKEMKTRKIKKKKTIFTCIV